MAFFIEILENPLVEFFLMFVLKTNSSYKYLKLT